MFVKKHFIERKYNTSNIYLNKYSQLSYHLNLHVIYFRHLPVDFPRTAGCGRWWELWRRPPYRPWGRVGVGVARPSPSEAPRSRWWPHWLDWSDTPPTPPLSAPPRRSCTWSWRRTSPTDRQTEWYKSHPLEHILNTSPQFGTQWRRLILTMCGSCSNYFFVDHKICGSQNIFKLKSNFICKPLKYIYIIYYTFKCLNWNDNSLT